MAMLASKAPYPASFGASSGPSSSQYSKNMSSSYRDRVQATRVPANEGHFASPTESEFSETFDSPDSVKNWDEERVGEWLRSIKCAQYAELFKVNNINGENLMEMDHQQLKEMGIKKIGDRVRIGTQAKLFRNREYNRNSKRKSNRESLALLDNPNFTPPSSGSPRPLHSARSGGSNSRPDKRMSRQIMGADYAAAMNFGGTRSPSRPGSPYVDQENRSYRQQRYGGMSPKDAPRKDYFAHPASAGTASSYRGGITPTTEAPQTARYAGGTRTPQETPQTARFGHTRGPGSLDGSTNSSLLPTDKPLIRVIFDSGRSSVVSIDNCKNVDDIVLKSLRKGGLNEAHLKSYCFYVLDGIEPEPSRCRRLGDSDLLRVCFDGSRLERNRLILRKIHLGPPSDEQLSTAAKIAAEQDLHIYRPNLVVPRGHITKPEKILGEPLPSSSYPQSPNSIEERRRNIESTRHDLERPDSHSFAARARKMKDFYGARPPSELITSDLTSYFPDVGKDEIDKTIRMSVRRSRRMSKAASRISTASNLSVVSVLKDAPPLPAISDAFLHNLPGQSRPPRPLSVMRLGQQRNSTYRDSVTSSVLGRLDEEEDDSATSEPNRKSYVSFGGDSCSSDTVAITDPDGNTTLHSYFDDGGSSVASRSSGDAGDSFNKRLSQALAEDGEEEDAELTEYLESDSWENIKYMKGALIGQGSFGSVYLALHSVTGELMAVKQVEMPSTSGSQLDAKKNSMVEALKHEIALLRDLKHPNIVQYLGSNSDDTHLNIFLEYVPGGSVATMLVNYGPLGESLISNFVRQILTGLAYLHSKDIIHRDIKGANILVDNKGAVKISDFGISKRVDPSILQQGNPKKAAGPRVSMQGSVFWMAPEVVKQTAYTRKADIWSLGCLIVEMFTGAHPHPNCTQLQAIFKIGGSGDARPTVPDNASPDARTFLNRTFEIDHEKRPTANELLLSAFCNPKA
ncbi:Ste11-type MAPKK kinase [Lineolata rhizophorae]|uniref:mitogen-activated protein kinase n=1 Tax=Lineolata rhizophorae TaxID=578093 RepID=A0A6A6P8V4_9PEZI|nr:Ste11-type MAPKK kinase [Lineolata rhizophorae]